MLNKSKYGYLFEYSPFPILLVSENGDILDYNLAFEKLLGFERAELIGLNFTTAPFIPSKYHKMLLERKEKLLQGKSLPTTYIQLKKKNGRKIWLTFNSSLIELDNKMIFQLIGYDITDQKKAEEQLISSYDRANFYKDLFIHDMKNIFQNISSALELYTLYQKEGKTKDKTSTLFNILEEQTKRGLELIKNVSKLSKVEESKIPIKKVEVINVLNEAIEFIHKSHPRKQIKIEVVKESEQFFVNANELLIDVFENLLGNTIKHNENPVIQIQIKISTESKRKKEFLKIQFLDNARGIPDNLKEEIFLRVKGKTKTVQGMGLGLSLVKFIIEGYKGDILVENRIRGNFTKGSNFIVFIPMAS